MTTTVSSLSYADRAQGMAPIVYVAIVDDDDAVRRALARLLRAHSFHVRTYQSGREFLASLNIGVPACLIVDLQMDDMTGLELLHHLAGAGRRIPAIVVTARDEPGMDLYQFPGAVALLIKPVMRDLLLQAIKAALSAPGSAGAQAVCW